MPPRKKPTTTAQEPAAPIPAGWDQQPGDVLTNHQGWAGEVVYAHVRGFYLFFAPPRSEWLILRRPSAQHVLIIPLGLHDAAQVPFDVALTTALHEQWIGAPAEAEPGQVVASLAGEAFETEGQAEEDSTND